MKNPPKFSVIISALNEEKYIENTIKSILNQKNKNFELIVSDGLSSDKTVEIAKKYTDNIISSKDRNLGAGRNKGAKIAKGEILVFVDADTQLPPETLDIIQKRIENGSIGGSFAVKFWDGNIKYSVISAFFNWFISTMHLVTQAGYGPCMFFSRKIFDEVNGFSENVIFEDQDIARRIRIKTGKKIDFIKEHAVFASARRVKEKGFINYCLTDIKLYIKDRMNKFGNYHKEYFNS